MWNARGLGGLGGSAPEPVGDPKHELALIRFVLRFHCIFLRKTMIPHQRRGVTARHGPGAEVPGPRPVGRLGPETIGTGDCNIDIWAGAWGRPVPPHGMVWKVCIPQKIKHFCKTICRTIAFSLILVPRGRLGRSWAWRGADEHTHESLIFLGKYNEFLKLSPNWIQMWFTFLMEINEIPMENQWFSRSTLKPHHHPYDSTT